VAIRPARNARIALLVVSASLLGAAVLPGVGEAKPTMTLAQVEAQVSALQERAEVAQEQVYRAQMALASRQRSLRSLQSAAAKAEAVLGTARHSIGQLAAAAYRSGGMDQTLQLLVADDPERFMAQASTLSVLSRHQADVVRAVSTASDRMAQAKLAVTAEVGQLERVRDTAAREQATVQTLVRQARDLLASLQAAQRAELARRQAAERARQLAEQRVLAAANAKAADAIPATTGRASRSNPRTSAVVPTSGGAGRANGSIGQRVLAYALAQVGKSYVYAGVGPTSYDCSGLTMMAYRSVGIHLPRYGGHGGQADVGRHVPISQLMPGDLVLYYPPSLHHIAMYAGNGRIVHAANPRAGVLTDSLNSMPIAFAVRPY